MLRHHFASVPLEDGVSIKAVAEFLGHADPRSLCGRTRTSCLQVRTVCARLLKRLGPRGRLFAHVPWMCPEPPCRG